jgi:acetolactate synthase-1/2/3 large subunit
MPVYDALLDTRIDIIHARHEAACVHMADAYARLSGKPGIALVTGGQAHVNATAALVTAAASSSPVVLLSGHAALSELGSGAFQELSQVQITAPLTKLSHLVDSTAHLGMRIADALKIARSGRPGPVHLSMPIDLLEQRLALSDMDNSWPRNDAARPDDMPLSPAARQDILDRLSAADKPLILHGPQLCGHRFRNRLRRLETCLQVPVIGMESPRGGRDPSLGAFADILRDADLIVLLDKDLDFTLGFGSSPAIRSDCRIVSIDPAASATHSLSNARIDVVHHADALGVLHALELELDVPPAPQSWLRHVHLLLGHRPPDWNESPADYSAPDHGKVHPVDLCDAVARVFERHQSVTFVSDGGEFGQWAQAIIKPERRLINGVSGTIGVGLPFAIGAQLAEPESLVVVMTGDGSFGFHMAEIDTAVRYGLPVVVIIGNDARWNAEYQIQLRGFGSSRTHSCDLLPSRYDKVVEALGGYGELVTHADQLDAALARAIASGKPACLNVLIEPVPAPVIRYQSL